MDWISASLPFWILGAPLVLGIVDWLRTPKVHGNTQEGRGYARATAAA